jgi:hypothetical protein
MLYEYVLCGPSMTAGFSDNPSLTDHMTKSFYKSCAVCNFYGTEIKIWAGLGTDRSTEKKLWLIMSVF